MFSSRALCFAAAVGLLTILVTAEPHLTFEDADAADGRLLGGTVTCESSEYLDDDGCKDCLPGCDVCNDATTCTRCKSSMYLHHGQCKQTCPTGFIPTGSGAVVKTCEETRFAFRTGELVQSRKDPSIVGYVVGFSNDKVEVSRRYPYTGSKPTVSEPMTPTNLHTISVGDTVSSHYGEGLVRAVDFPDSVNAYVMTPWGGIPMTEMRLVSKAYTVVQAFGGNAVCNAKWRIQASCDDCGPHWGTFDQCKELCDSHSGCSYFTYLNDARCQMYSSCSMPVRGSATTAIYRNARRADWKPHPYKIVHADRGSRQVCKGQLIDASGAGWGDLERCKEWCDLHIGCSYLTYFSDRGCRLYSSCEQTVPQQYLNSDGTAVTSAIHEKQKLATAGSYAKHLASAASKRAVCQGARLQVPCGNCGPKWGNLDRCQELCDSIPQCTHVTYFSNLGCQIFSSCKLGSQSYEADSIDSTIYQQQVSGNGRRLSAVLV